VGDPKAAAHVVLALMRVDPFIANVDRKPARDDIRRGGLPK